MGRTTSVTITIVAVAGAMALLGGCSQQAGTSASSTTVGAGATPGRTTGADAQHAPTFLLDSSTDWEQLVAALQTVPGPKSIQVVGDDVVVDTPGVWDLNGAGWIGDGNLGRGYEGSSMVTFGDGVTFVHPGRLLASGGVVLNNASTTGSPFTLTGNDSAYFDNDAYGVSTGGTALVTVDAAATGVLVRFAFGSGLLQPSRLSLPAPNQAALHIDPASSGTVVAMPGGNTLMDDDTIDGGGVIIYAASAAAGVGNPMLPPTGFSHSGADFVARIPVGVLDNLAYRPSEPADWDDQDPPSAAAALDELAARVRELER